MKTKKKRSSSEIEHFFFPIFDEDQKKGFLQKQNTFFPNFRWRPTKKKGLQLEYNTFFPKFTLSCTPIQLIGGNADVDHSQTIGGDTAKLLGGYIPPVPPGFGTTANNYVGESSINAIFKAGKTKQHLILLIWIALIKLKDVLYVTFLEGTDQKLFLALLTLYFALE